MVGVVAHQRRHVEGGAQPGLAVIEQVAEPLVGLLRRPEPRELPHRPQPAAVHARVHPARERILAGEADRVGRRQVRLGVQRLHRLTGQRRERARPLGRRGIALGPRLEPGSVSLPRLRRHRPSLGGALGADANPPRRLAAATTVVVGGEERLDGRLRGARTRSPIRPLRSRRTLRSRMRAAIGPLAVYRRSIPTRTASDSTPSETRTVKVSPRRAWFSVGPR